MSAATPWAGTPASPRPAPLARGYRFELLKLVSQWRVRLLVLACWLAPGAFVGVVSRQGALPVDTVFGRLMHSTGWAGALVVLAFACVWPLPLLTALVVGDVFAVEDRLGTWRHLLLAVRSKRRIFAAKALASATVVVLLVLGLAVSGLVGGLLLVGSGPLAGLDGYALDGTALAGRFVLAWLCVLAPTGAFAAVGLLARSRSVAPRWAWSSPASSPCCWPCCSCCPCPWPCASPCRARPSPPGEGCSSSTRRSDRSPSASWSLSAGPPRRRSSPTGCSCAGTSPTSPTTAPGAASSSPGCCPSPCSPWSSPWSSASSPRPPARASTAPGSSARWRRRTPTSTGCRPTSWAARRSRRTQLRTSAACDKGGSLVDDEGAGNDWRCVVSWHLPGARAVGSAVYQLDVAADGRYVADGDGPQEVNGFFLLQARHGPAPNPLWQFDGLVDLLTPTRKD